MRELLSSAARQVGDPNPDCWAENTAYMHFTTLYHILNTCDVAGVPTDGFADLQAPGALKVLQDRLRPGECKAIKPHPLASGPKRLRNQSAQEASWGGVYICSIFRSLRTMSRAAGVPASARLTALITFYDQAEKRDINHRLVSKEVYLAGAMALDAFGRLAEAAGRSRGSSIRIGARLLAVLAEGSPQRGEAGQADRTLVRLNPMAEQQEVNIFIRRASSKARRGRVLVLRDPRAVHLVGELCQGPGGHELFRAPDGAPLSLPYLDGLLRRVTVMAVGLPASFNLLRRANAAAEKTSEARRAQLGHVSGSNIADEEYHPGLAPIGFAAMTAARARRLAAAGALESGGTGEGS